MTALAQKYRPRSFADTVGQKHVKAVLRQMVIQGQVPPALLFTGPRGTGKTTTARVFAAALNCSVRAAESAEPCGLCPSCKGVFDSSSPDVLEIDAASNGLVGDIRALRDALLYEVPGLWRLVLLDEAHSMSREAFNALLKTLEEPPDQTVFVLLTTEPDRIIETVRSRCMGFEFRRLAPADIESRLRHVADVEGMAVPDELLVEISHRVTGALRDAVTQLDQVGRVGVKTVAEFRDLVGDVDYSVGIFQALVAGDLAGAYAQVDQAMSTIGDPQSVVASLTHLIRDLFVIQGGGSVPWTGESLLARQAFASSLLGERLFGAARVLWDFKTRVRVSDDPRSSLELAVCVLGESLGGLAVGGKRLPDGDRDKPRVLTMQELKDIAMGKTV